MPKPDQPLALRFCQVPVVVQRRQHLEVLADTENASIVISTAGGIGGDASGLPRMTGGSPESGRRRAAPVVDGVVAQQG